MVVMEDGLRAEPLGNEARCFEVRNYAPVETTARLVCWEFAGGRTLSVNGQSAPCLTGDGFALTEPRGDGYCIEVSAGENEFAGLLLPTQ